MIVSIDDLKAYFQTGDKPTQQQFENLIDTLNANKGLVVLAPGTTSWAAPKDTFIDDVVVLKGEGVDEQYATIGITEEGSEILNNEFWHIKGVFPVKYYCEVARTIYFSGVDEGSIIKLYIK